MAEKKKEKSYTVKDCPLGHEKSMSYVSKDLSNQETKDACRVARRMGPNAKIALCSECGLILTFVDIKKDSKIIED